MPNYVMNQISVQGDPKEIQSKKQYGGCIGRELHADRTCEKHHNGGFTNDQKESHAEENTRPPKINFALFAPQMAFAQNLELPLGSCFLAAMNESLAAYLRQQTIFMHDTPNGLVVVMLTVLTLDPKLDPTTAVRAHILPTITTCLNLFHQKRFSIQLFASLSEAVISAA